MEIYKITFILTKLHRARLYTTPPPISLFFLLGADHQLGAHVFIKVFLAESLELHGTGFQGDALLVSILGNLGSHVIANDRVQAGHKHQTGCELVKMVRVKRASQVIVAYLS